MSLIVQALAVLAGGLLLARLLRGVLTPLRSFAVAGVGLLVVLAAGVLFVVHGYETASTLTEQTQAAAEASPSEAEHAADPRAQNEFLEWARQTMLAAAHGRGGAATGTYYIEPAAVLQEAELGQWSTYELLPERATASPAEAEWILFYGVAPRLTPSERDSFGTVDEYAPGFALARRSDAD
ncbi:MAG TPA: hypothetical protein VMB51_01980 [Solirubrobacteraceae bacterium]|nr:hypothetical protein [Solirubrobacteraceae bacterium]